VADSLSATVAALENATAAAAAQDASSLVAGPTLQCSSERGASLDQSSPMTGHQDAKKAAQPSDSANDTNTCDNSATDGTVCALVHVGVYLTSEASIFPTLALAETGDSPVDANKGNQVPHSGSDDIFQPASKKLSSEARLSSSESLSSLSSAIVTEAAAPAPDGTDNVAQAIMKPAESAEDILCPKKRSITKVDTPNSSNEGVTPFAACSTESIAVDTRELSTIAGLGENPRRPSSLPRAVVAATDAVAGVAVGVAGGVWTLLSLSLASFRFSDLTSLSSSDM
jgi:hypothetical protein